MALCFYGSMALCLFVSMFHYFHLVKRHSSKNYIVFLQVSMFHFFTFNMCHIFIGFTSFMFYVLRLFSFSFLQIGW